MGGSSSLRLWWLREPISSGWSGSGRTETGRATVTTEHSLRAGDRSPRRCLRSGCRLSPIAGLVMVKEGRPDRHLWVTCECDGHVQSTLSV
jgi:hypothetical protein